MLQASGTIAGRLMAGARLSLFLRKTALVPSRLALQVRWPQHWLRGRRRTNRLECLSHKL